MGNERVNTGGTKDFVYTKEDLDRIRNTDTEATEEFKREYREWRLHRGRRKRHISVSYEQGIDEFLGGLNASTREKYRALYNRIKAEREVQEAEAAERRKQARRVARDKKKETTTREQLSDSSDDNTATEYERRSALRRESTRAKSDAESRSTEENYSSADSAVRNGIEQDIERLSIYTWIDVAVMLSLAIAIAMLRQTVWALPLLAVEVYMCVQFFRHAYRSHVLRKIRSS